MDYEGFMSTTTKRLGSHGLRELMTLIQNGPEDLLSLTAGLPNVASFLLNQMTITLPDGAEIELNKEQLIKAQQYWAVSGLTNFSDLLNQLVRQLHSPPCWNKSPEDGQTVVHPTSGGTDGINQVFNTILEEGDHIIMGEASYPGPITLIQAMGVVPVTVPLDQYGMIPEKMREALSKWDPDAAPGTTDKPKLIYTIPTGHNPTGVTYSLERKKEIYQIARDYNILIFEDDPYYLTTFDELIPSFLSLDTDGRVFRSDSFSKTLGPGFRSGYLSGPAILMKKILYRIGVTSYGTCALSQVIITAIFDKLGIDGFLDHTRRVTELYKKQRDIMLKYADKWLEGLVEYDIPLSGMFVWMKVKGVQDTRELMMDKGLKAGILAVPGEMFSPVKGVNSPYIRVTYSMFTEQIFDKAFERLAVLIRAEVK